MPFKTILGTSQRAVQPIHAPHREEAESGRRLDSLDGEDVADLDPELGHLPDEEGSAPDLLADLRDLPKRYVALG